MLVVGLHNEFSFSLPSFPPFKILVFLSPFHYPVLLFFVVAKKKGGQ
jgi:hypothetical protein